MKYLCNDEDRVLDGVVDLDMALEMPFIVAEITLKGKNKNISTIGLSSLYPKHAY